MLFLRYQINRKIQGSHVTDLDGSHTFTFCVYGEESGHFGNFEMYLVRKGYNFSYILFGPTTWIESSVGKIWTRALVVPAPNKPTNGHRHTLPSGNLA